MTDLALLALEEGLPGSHIAADLALPLGLLVFCGSVYVLVWSVYGAKKGALVYGAAFSAFAFVMGLFWWFGAPGTPIATGLQYFPGQENTRYQGKWFAMEPGSERAEEFAVTNSLEEFQTPAEFVGLGGASPEELEANPKYRNLVGDLSAAKDQMLALYLQTNEADQPVIGQRRRAELREAAGEPREGETPGDPFFTARVAPTEEGGEGQVLVARDRGLRVAGATLQVVANYESTDESGAPQTRVVVAEEAPFYAFKDPGALWFPSAVWTLVSLAIFGLCLFGLDRIEMREKATRATVEREPVEVGG